MLGVLYIIIGLVLLFWPGLSVQLICHVVGGAILLYGASRIVRYVSSRKNSTAEAADLVIGILTALVGAFIAMNATFIASILPWMCGLVMFIGSIGKIQTAFALKRAQTSWWKGTMLSAVVTAFLGLTMLMNPFASVLALIRFFGVALLLDGVSGVISQFMLNKNR